MAFNAVIVSHKMYRQLCHTAGPHAIEMLAIDPLGKPMSIQPLNSSTFESRSHALRERVLIWRNHNHEEKRAPLALVLRGEGLGVRENVRLALYRGASGLNTLVPTLCVGTHGIDALRRSSFFRLFLLGTG
jgi:hypothetical protein